MPDDIPETPLSALMASAVQLHELYASFVNSGFSADQALALVQTALASSITKGE